MCGCVLEVLERRVRLERLRKVLDGLCIEVVDGETVNGGAYGVSAAADAPIRPLFAAWAATS